MWVMQSNDFIGLDYALAPHFSDVCYKMLNWISSRTSKKDSATYFLGEKGGNFHAESEKLVDPFLVETMMCR